MRRPVSTPDSNPEFYTAGIEKCREIITKAGFAQID
jgi:hypothetical protein